MNVSDIFTYIWSTTFDDSKKSISVFESPDLRGFNFIRYIYKMEYNV